MPPIRLQKILSKAGISSRRQAEQFILQGRVKVNGQVVTELGLKVDPHKDHIAFDDKQIFLDEEKAYYAYYKPRGMVVSKKDELGRQSFFDTLDLPKSFNSVGRLDKDSEGLLLLSNDGEFIQSYTHPSYEISKIYHVCISRRLEPGEQKRLLEGVVLENKLARVVRVVSIHPSRHPGLDPGSRQIAQEHWIELELKEGMKREIRRMLELFGIKVLRLIRVQHGEIKLGDLKSGEIRRLKTRPKCEK